MSELVSTSEAGGRSMIDDLPKCDECGHLGKVMASEGSTGRPFWNRVTTTAVSCSSCDGQGWLVSAEGADDE